ncbi:MAG: hypothetical protein KDI56_13540 [Xanthomonadales bacterium]|nr:hypothetical protein [Xanthomonadales bacterium]
MSWVLLALLLTGLLWLVLIRGYADALARQAPERAIRLNPAQPVALAQLACRALAEGETDRATGYAERAARASFFNGHALRVLGALAERRGDQNRALALMSAAATAQPRDTATQYWLALHAISNQDPDEAMARLDRVMRFEPAIVDELFPLLGTFASNPVGVRAVVPYLARRPDWRPRFMEHMLRQAELSVVIRLSKLLSNTDGPLTDDERAALTTALAGRRDWNGLRELAGPDAPLLRDGSLRGVAAGPMTSWRLDPVKGADVRLGPDGLRTYFYGRRVEAPALARQLLLLPPGQYELTGQVWLNHLQGPAGLAWVVRCEQPNGRLLASSESFAGESGWRGWLLSMTVPVGQCGGQWLSLEIPARIAAERELHGEAAFRDLAIRALQQAP